MSDPVRKMQVVEVVLTPLSQLDGGVWATDETNDTSELRARMGTTGVLPPEPAGYRIGPRGELITGDNAVV
jgi:hypothetical protein